jgi:hypothetical protein
MLSVNIHSIYTILIAMGRERKKDKQLTNSVPEEGPLLFQSLYKHHHIILNHLLLDFIHPLVLQIIINNKTLSFWRQDQSLSSGQNYR